MNDVFFQLPYQLIVYKIKCDRSMARLLCCWISVTLCVLCVTIIFARRCSVKFVSGRSKCVRQCLLLDEIHSEWVIFWNIHRRVCIFVPISSILRNAFFRLIMNIWYHQITDDLNYFTFGNSIPSNKNHLHMTHLNWKG